jgi:GT2 family glycosyltransferase/glycosyltransferase involved in cell wall biosynthesis
VSPRAAVVIPVYERADLLAPCLESLVDAGLSGVELILVDNASTGPAMAPLLAAWEGSARIIRNPANLGFATACNQGAEASTAPVTVFLNTDTEVRRGWLDPLMDALEDPSVGMAGSRLLYPDGRIQHAGMALIPGGLPVHVHRGVPGDHPVATRSRDLRMVTAACCAMPRGLFMEVGGFDAGYRNGHEDVDLCLRLCKGGYRVRYRGDSVVVHHESMSPGRLDADGANALRFRERWYGWPADWAEVLAEDGVHDTSWADCWWEGPLLDASPEAALGRAAIRALMDEGRRPFAQDLAPAPLAPDAAELCDAALLTAMNRPMVRVPAADTFLHLRGGERLTPATGAGVTIAVVGPAAIPSGGVGGARAVLVAGAEALPAAEAAGALPRRIAALDPGDPRPEAARRAVLGATPVREGIGWCGPLLGRSGYAAAGRGLLRAAQDAGLPVRALSADDAAPGIASPPLPLPAQDFMPSFWVAHHPPVLPSGVESWKGMSVAIGAPVVGATCFETEGLPAGWVEASEHVLEVWVPSGFNRRTFTEAGMDPSRVHVVPYPVDTALLTPRSGPRPGGPVTFLSVFEWTWRKGWDVLLQAWAEEFAAGDPVRLVVLTYRGAGASGEGDVMEQAVAHLATLGQDPERIADVDIQLEPVPHSAMPALYRSADAFVLPTRGEGAGMPVLEAAASGLPVIATAWGGHEEVMDPSIAFPVSVERMVEAAPELLADNSLYAGLLLAEPSVASLRAQLRAVAEDPAGAAARARGARALVEERYSFAAAGGALEARAAAVLAERLGPRVPR